MQDFTRVLILRLKEHGDWVQFQEEACSGSCILGEKQTSMLSKKTATVVTQGLCRVMPCSTWGESKMDSWFSGIDHRPPLSSACFYKHFLEAQPHLLACIFPACGYSQSRADQTCHQMAHDLKIFIPQPFPEIHRIPILETHGSVSVAEDFLHEL